MMSEPVLILATDQRPEDPSWLQAEQQAARLQTFAARVFGVAPQIALARLPTQAPEDLGEYQLGRVIDRVGSKASMVLVLPTAFELSVWQKTMVGEELSEIRRRHPAVAIHHDTVDPTHPFLVECFASSVFQVLEKQQISPQQAGLILVADGRGDPSTRADSYRLMRLLWEQTGLSGGEVGFVRHPQPFLTQVLEKCTREPRGWLLVPQCQWEGTLTDYAGVMLGDHQRAHPEAIPWLLLEPPRDHPAIMAWLEQRLLKLWQDKRAKQAARIPSAKYQASSSEGSVWTGQDWQPVREATLQPQSGLLGRAREATALAEVLERVLPKADRYLIKVTWHGYAQGTYSGAGALDLLLSALPGRAVIVEGHTSSRNAGGLDIDWETEAVHHRAWIQQQDAEFLRRTGLADVISKHKAQYVNVTEAWWDGLCASAEEVEAVLGDIKLQNRELATFVPSLFMELRGAPLISFARFKGPTRLGISNLFGLIPHPLRTAWHGAAITDFAAVCCDLARLYGALFPSYGLVEAFESAVRWDKKGLYRSRWGNYDLVLTDGIFTLSKGLVGADLLASRLQGQDVRRSSFYDVVRTQLGWPNEASELILPADIQASLI